MVRLKREMVGLEWDESLAEPPFRANPELVEHLEAAAVASALTTIDPKMNRLLVVGAPPGLVQGFLEGGVEHLSVVEPDVPRRQRLIKRLGIEPTDRRVTVHARHYADIGFERSSFDGAVLFDCLNRYPSPTNVLRKCSREVKMGCSLFVRIDVQSPIWSRPAQAAKLAGGLPGPLKRGFKLLERWLYPVDSRWPVDSDALVESVEDLVSAGEPIGGLKYGVLLALAVVRLPKRLRASLGTRLLNEAIRLDGRLPSSPATVWYAFKKDVGFGRVFQVDSDRE